MKPKVAFYWCTSCGGCEEAVLDLGKDLFNVLEKIEIVFWPVAMDVKYKDIEEMEDKSIDVAFINGGIRTEEHEEKLKLLRKKSKIVIAFGVCAQLGGIPGLANYFDFKEVLKRGYIEAESIENPKGILPKKKSDLEIEGKSYELNLPGFIQKLKCIDEVIDVDYYLPGCPPQPTTISNALEALLSGKLPKKGTVLGEEKSLCHFCKRNETKPDEISIEKFFRPHEKIEEEKCLLAEGILCMGPVTAGDCGSKCINANMPCRGCYGPVPNVDDMGLRMLSALASISFVGEEEELSEKELEEKTKEFFKNCKDLVGTLYRFSLAKAHLMKLKEKKNEDI